MFVLAALAGIVATAAYWFRFRRGRVSPAGLRAPGSLLLPALLVSAFILLIFADRAGPGGTEGGKPIFVAVAMDLSLSMAAAPDSSTAPDVGTRMERARGPLLELIGALEASAAPVMMSVTGFTMQSQPILVWDDDLPQVREVVEHVLVPGLLTKPGSDLGAGLRGVLPHFDNLPQAYGGEASERFLIMVSDGEQTVDRFDVASALAEVRSRGIRTVALHVGSLGVPEGLRLYNQEGLFSGFKEVGGELYSFPDPRTMSLIAGNDSGAGLFVEVDKGSAASKIYEFIGINQTRTTSDHFHLGVSLALLSFVLTLLLWYV